MQYLVLKSYSYLICFSDDTAFPSRCILFLVTIWFVTLVYVKVAVHFILCVRVVSMILVISRLLERALKNLIYIYIYITGLVQHEHRHLLH